MQFEPDTRDAFTYLDPADGERYAIGWQIPTEKEHLRRKLEALRLSTLKTFGIFGRPPDYGSMMALGFLAVNDKIERENPEFAQNVRDFIKLSRAHNLMSTDLIPDVQADRRIPASEKPGRLRAVEERPDGIVLYGAKPCGSIGSISHFFTLSTALSPGLDEAACLWGVLPANIEGLTYLGDLKAATSHAEALKSFAPDFLDAVLSGKIEVCKLPEHNKFLLEGLRLAGL